MFKIGNVRNSYLYYSFGGTKSVYRGIRPVVSLKSDTQLKEGTNGSYDIK